LTLGKEILHRGASQGHGRGRSKRLGRRVPRRKNKSLQSGNQKKEKHIPRIRGALREKGQTRQKRHSKKREETAHKYWKQKKKKRKEQPQKEMTTQPAPGAMRLVHGKRNSSRTGRVGRRENRLGGKKKKRA